MVILAIVKGQRQVGMQRRELLSAAMASDIGSGQEWQPSSVLGIESDGINQLSGSARRDTAQPRDFSTKSGFRSHECLLRTERLGFTELSIGNRRFDRVLDDPPVVSGRDSE